MKIFKSASRIKTLRSRLLLLTLMASAANVASGSYLLTITQAGANVVGGGSGTLDMLGLTDAGSALGGGLIWGTYPGGGSAIGLGDFSANVEQFSGSITGGSGTFGSGDLAPAFSGTGDPVDIAPAFDAIFVPIGYVSGSHLSSTAVWDDTTLAELGLLPGSYTYAWSTGPTADSFTIAVSNAPEPRMLGLLGLAMVFFALAPLNKRPDNTHGLTQAQEDG